MFHEVVDEKKTICVILHSTPYVAILSHEKYQELLKKAKKYDEQSGGGKKK